MAETYETITYADLCVRMGGVQTIPVYHMDAHEGRPRLTAYVPCDAPGRWIVDLHARMCTQWPHHAPGVRVVLVLGHPVEALWPRWVTHQEVAL